MRIMHLVFTGSIAALAALTAPALAKNSHTQKIDDPPTTPVSSNCHAYQQAPDGTWNPLPCQENGGTAQTQARPKSASGN
jgi:hypothetical protein